MSFTDVHLFHVKHEDTRFIANTEVRQLLSLLYSIPKHCTELHQRKAFSAFSESVMCALGFTKLFKIINEYVHIILLCISVCEK